MQQNNEFLEEFNYIISLFEIYEKLLTEKQSQYFKYYYYDNYSLSEIAQFLEVSKNAIHDTINKVSKNLKQYEEKLNIYKNKITRISLIEKLPLEIQNLKQVKEIRKLDE